MTTGKYELVIKWASGQSTICGEMTDHQHGEICRILSPDYRAKLPSQGGEPVAWREHSVNYAKGEKCPETIETLQAAWDRDQELINDMRHEIARHKTRINRLEQRHQADQVARGVAELKALLPALDDALEDLELHGRHSDQGYRKLKDWYRKAELITDRIDDALLNGGRS